MDIANSAVALPKGLRKSAVAMRNGARSSSSTSNAEASMYSDTGSEIDCYRDDLPAGTNGGLSGGCDSDNGGCGTHCFSSPPATGPGPGRGGLQKVAGRSGAKNKVAALGLPSARDPRGAWRTAILLSRR